MEFLSDTEGVETLNGGFDCVEDVRESMVVVGVTTLALVAECMETFAGRSGQSVSWRPNHPDHSPSARFTSSSVSRLLGLIMDCDCFRSRVGSAFPSSLAGLLAAIG